jgi:hypothetical protein
MDFLLSTAYLPNIEYFGVIKAANHVWIENHETYARQTYRNRCYIAGPNGRQMLIIPVVRPNGNHTSINEILIDNKQAWQKIHWRSIETAYNRSAFFQYYKDEFETLFTEPYYKLIDFNQKALWKLLKILHIDKNILLTEKYSAEWPEEIIDLRNEIVPNRKGILSNVYFESYFQPFSPKYGFLPNLSVIDLLFNQGPYSGEYIHAIAQHIEEIIVNR